MVSGGTPCCKARDATTALSRAAVSIVVPIFSALKNISARRPSSKYPSPAVYLKPSEVAASCAAAAARLVPKYFDPRAVAVVEGAVPETTALLEQQWDFIFFTGSPPVGKIVHQAAAKHLTPCVLELGGKNPTIVHSSANLKVAARRIVNGRFMNSGHICTAPDHVLVWPEVKDELVRHLVEAIHEFYGDDPEKSPDYGRVINRRNFDRLVGLLGSGKVVAGGQSDPAELYIAPTVLVDVSLELALRFASVHPAKFLGLDHRRGRLAPGCRADMVAIDPNDITVMQTWIAGCEADVGQ